MQQKFRAYYGFNAYGKIMHWEIEHPDDRHGDLEYIYYIWQAPMKSTWISIFEGNYGDGEDFECIFVGQPQKLIDKYKDNTNEEG